MDNFIKVLSSLLSLVWKIASKLSAVFIKVVAAVSEILVGINKEMKQKRSEEQKEKEKMIKEAAEIVRLNEQNSTLEAKKKLEILLSKNDPKKVKEILKNISLFH